VLESRFFANSYEIPIRRHVRLVSPQSFPHLWKKLWKIAEIKAWPAKFLKLAMVFNNLTGSAVSAPGIFAAVACFLAFSIILVIGSLPALMIIASSALFLKFIKDAIFSWFDFEAGMPMSSASLLTLLVKSDKG